MRTFLVVVLLLFGSCFNGTPPEEPYLVDWSFIFTGGSGQVGYTYEDETVLYPIVVNDSIKFSAPLYSEVGFTLNFTGAERPGTKIRLANDQAGPYPDRWVVFWTEGTTIKEQLLFPDEFIYVRVNHGPFQIRFRHNSPGEIDFTELKILVEFFDDKIRFISVLNRFN